MLHYIKIYNIIKEIYYERKKTNSEQNTSSRKNKNK